LTNDDHTLFGEYFSRHNDFGMEGWQFHFGQSETFRGQRLEDHVLMPAP
jgi:hypothetical protein